METGFKVKNNIPVRKGKNSKHAPFQFCLPLNRHALGLYALPLFSYLPVRAWFSSCIKNNSTPALASPFEAVPVAFCEPP